jgi:hypothetical protein
VKAPLTNEIDRERKRRIPDMTTELATPVTLESLVGQLKAIGC